MHPESREDSWAVLETPAKLHHLFLFVAVANLFVIAICTKIGKIDSVAESQCPFLNSGPSVLIGIKQLGQLTDAG